MVFFRRSEAEVYDILDKNSLRQYALKTQSIAGKVLMRCHQVSSNHVTSRCWRKLRYVKSTKPKPNPSFGCVPSSTTVSMTPRRHGLSSLSTFRCYNSCSRGPLVAFELWARVTTDEPACPLCYD